MALSDMPDDMARTPLCDRPAIRAIRDARRDPPPMRDNLALAGAVAILIFMLLVGEL